MYKKGQTNPEKFQNWTQHSCCSMLTREENLKAIRGNGYRFVPKGGTFPTENHHPCFEKLRFLRSIHPNLPQIGQNLYHAMLMPLHDSMPSFMNFKRVLDLLEFKNQASQCFAGNQRCPGFEIHSHFLHGTLACTQGHKFYFSTNLYALEHVHVVQIWIMHINALKTQLVHKNVQMNPQKSQKLKAIRGNRYCFVPNSGTFPTEKHHASCEKRRFVRST